MSQKAKNSTILFVEYFCEFFDTPGTSIKIWKKNISMILNLNYFYSIFAKKRNSHGHFKYRTRAIITRSRFEAALDHKPQIFLKNTLFLLHKLSAV